MEKHVESKYFFTKFGHFYFLFLLYFTCTSIITFCILCALFPPLNKMYDSEK